MNRKIRMWKLPKEPIFAPEVFEMKHESVIPPFAPEEQCESTSICLTGNQTNKFSLQR